MSLRKQILKGSYLLKYLFVLLLNWAEKVLVRRVRVTAHQILDISCVRTCSEPETPAHLAFLLIVGPSYTNFIFSPLPPSRTPQLVL